MPQSDLTFVEDEPVTIGSHGEHNFLYEEGEPIDDSGRSNIAFEAGTGLSVGVGEYQLYIIADNFFEVYVNGQSVGSRMSGYHGDWDDGPYKYQVALPSGESVIATAGYNSDGTDGPYTGADTSGSSGAFVAWGILDGDGNVAAESDQYNTIDEITFFNDNEPAGDWTAPDYDDSGWQSTPPVSSSPVKSEKGNITDTDFPDPLDPHMYWNEEGSNPQTEHVDEVFARCYVTL